MVVVVVGRVWGRDRGEFFSVAVHLERFCSTAFLDLLQQAFAELCPPGVCGGGTSRGGSNRTKLSTHLLL